MTNPGRYALLKARLDAWVEALILGGAAEQRDLAEREHPWQDAGPSIVSAVELRPARAGAVPLIVGRARVDEGDDIGLGAALAIGSPAHAWGLVPVCSCDACDDGSGPLLEQLDDEFLTVLRGRVLLVVDGERMVRRTQNGWSSTGSFGLDEPQLWLDGIVTPEPNWTVVQGDAWL